jgi:hypothetical protein
MSFLTMRIRLVSLRIFKSESFEERGMRLALALTLLCLADSEVSHSLRPLCVECCYPCGRLYHSWRLFGGRGIGT